MIYAGIAVLRNSLWAVLPLPLVLVVIQREVIGREERYLERTFGEEYRSYKTASEGNALLNNFFVTTVMLAMGNSDRMSMEGLRTAFHKNVATVQAIPVSQKACKVYAADARSLPLSDGTVNLVVTSPPYINVFNYHQNYRKAMELMGWSPLEVARSELGSNRKHRMNRFLTVTQYCMDLAEVFVELRRVLSPEGVAVFVVGRESNVRGVPFHNSRLLGLIAEGGVGFRLERWQERKFTNRFGELIYEDLLTLAPGTEGSPDPREFGREVGITAMCNGIDPSSYRRVDDSALYTVTHPIHPRRRQSSEWFNCTDYRYRGGPTSLTTALELW